MPGNIRRIAWYTRDGRQRRIRLYRAWVNLRGRITGGNSNQPWRWAGVQNEFASWEQFREWAIKNGYGKGKSLDRINEYGPYAPDNCQWLTLADHARKSTEARMRKTSHNAGCMCRNCIERRAKIPKHIKLPIEIDTEVGF